MDVRVGRTDLEIDIGPQTRTQGVQCPCGLSQTHRDAKHSSVEEEQEKKPTTCSRIGSVSVSLRGPSEEPSGTGMMLV